MCPICSKRLMSSWDTVTLLGVLLFREVSDMIEDIRKMLNQYWDWLKDKTVLREVEDTLKSPPRSWTDTTTTSRST